MIDYTAEITVDNCHEMANTRIEEFKLLSAHSASDLSRLVNICLDERYFLRGDSFMAPNSNSYMLFQALELDREERNRRHQKRFEARQFVKKLEG